jgi:hypothetical protein
MQHVKKNSVRIFVEKICKMRCLEGSGVPVLYIGRTVPIGSNEEVARRVRWPDVMKILYSEFECTSELIWLFNFSKWNLMCLVNVRLESSIFT